MFSKNKLLVEKIGMSFKLFRNCNLLMAILITLAYNQLSQIKWNKYCQALGTQEAYQG
jgi:hypothetical protein